MNGKDIFLGMRYVENALIEEAEFGEYHAETWETRKGRRSFRRPLLVAAAIAMTLLLVGCGVAYVMHMQDLTVGDREAAAQEWFGAAGTNGTQITTEQVLTLSGVKGSPNYQAAQDWFNFLQSYDPDHEILLSLQGNRPQFPEKYAAYSVYSQEMVDKIDSITAAYGLELLGTPVKYRTAKTLLRYLGLESILSSGSTATVDSVSSYYYEGGGLHLDFNLRTAGEQGNWPYISLCSLTLSPKDRFAPNLIALNDTGDWKDWTYQTAAGDQVLILRSPSNQSAWIFCDRADTAISVQVESIHTAYSDQGQPESTPMTDRQLEQVADAIDFQMQPQPGDPALLEGTVAGVDPTAVSQTQNGVTIMVKTVETDGHFAYITLGVTAPEGTVLLEDPEGSVVSFGNQMQGFFSPKTQRVIDGGSEDIQLLDDGDGKDNTMDILIQEQRFFTDGEDAFAPGEPWTLYIEDLKVQVVDPEIWDFVTVWESQGAWQFDISFEDGDFRELEFIQEPVTAKAATGMDMNGNDVFEDVTIISFKLRTYSGTVTMEGMAHPCDLCDRRNEKYPYVVLKDGTRIRMDTTCQPQYEKPLPMDEIELLLLPDGTKLYPVGR